MQRLSQERLLSSDRKGGTVIVVGGKRECPREEVLAEAGPIESTQDHCLAEHQMAKQREAAVFHASSRFFPMGLAHKKA